MENRIKPNPYLKELSCLYVEDEEMIRDSFFMLIKRYFKDVITAKNGSEGLLKFKENRPDIVISDIRMPVMNGIEMVKEIKKNDPDTFVIFITAFSDLEYLKSAIDLGVEGYLTKPIDKQKLLKKLNTLADIIKQKKDIENYFRLLQEIFDKQPTPTLLIENGNIKLKNKSFRLLFPEVDSFTKLLEFIKIDLSSQKQEISLNLNNKNITFRITVMNLNNMLMLITFDDISHLEKEIMTDELTQLYNRKIIDKIIESEKFEKLCAILFDIDNFKKINDTYGHPTGDKVLKELSKIAKNSVRKNDLVIRWGGEEFLILINENTDEKIIEKIAQNIRKQIDSYEFDTVKHVTCSFGIYCRDVYSKHEFNDLIKKADIALYKAKEKGKNRVEIFKN